MFSGVCVFAAASRRSSSGVANKRGSFQRITSTMNPPLFHSSAAFRRSSSGVANKKREVKKFEISPTHNFVVTKAFASTQSRALFRTLMVLI